MLGEMLGELLANLRTPHLRIRLSAKLGLLFIAYLVTMAFLILNVIEESISGVVILIYGIPITGIFLLFALASSSRPPQKRGWYSECPECGALNVRSKKQIPLLVFEIEELPARKIKCGGCGAAFFPEESKKYPPG